MTAFERKIRARQKPAAEEEYDRLCTILDAMDGIARSNGFYAVGSAIATQRVLLRKRFGLDGDVSKEGALR